jgi:hypothetical protein
LFEHHLESELALAQVFANPLLLEHELQVQLPETQVDLDSFQHLPLLEGLADIVNAAGAQGLDLVVDALERADEDDRNVAQARVLLELSADVQAGHLWHGDIQKDEIRRVRGGRLDGQSAAGDGSGLQAPAFQNCAQESQVLRRIVHDQDAAFLCIISHFASP